MPRVSTVPFHHDQLFQNAAREKGRMHTDCAMRGGPWTWLTTPNENSAAKPRHNRNTVITCAQSSCRDCFRAGSCRPREASAYKSLSPVSEWGRTSRSAGRAGERRSFKAAVCGNEMADSTNAIRHTRAEYNAAKVSETMKHVQEQGEVLCAGLCNTHAQYVAANVLFQLQ